MKVFQTEQESFWNGQFGNDYVDRNQGEQFVASAVHRFSDVFSLTGKITSCLELGSNIEMSLKAISCLLPSASLSAVEINKKAADECRKVVEGKGEVFETSILEFHSDKKQDFVFTSAVLIHIHPDFLNQVYETLYERSAKYIYIAEYYNPTPVEVDYRGHSGRLFKRDFAGEIMAKYQDLKLVSYGFYYHGDYNFPAGDATWFLMEKNK